MIKAICINDTKYPAEIPESHRPEKGKAYTIIHVYNMSNDKQEGILGCDIKEIDLIPLNLPYECFKMDRFGVSPGDLPALLKLAEDCAELNDFDISELFDEQLVLTEPEEEVFA